MQPVWYHLNTYTFKQAHAQVNNPPRLHSHTSSVSKNHKRSPRKHSAKAVNKHFPSGISHRCWGPWHWCHDAGDTPTMTQLWGFIRAHLSSRRQTVRVRHYNFAASIHLNHSQTLLSPQGAGTEANSHRRSKWRVMKDMSLSGKYTMRQPSWSHLNVSGNADKWFLSQ